MNEESSPPSKKQKTSVSELENNTPDDLGTESECLQIEDNFENFVTPEELAKLREFTVLDEVKSNDEESDDEESDDDGKSEGVPEDEIEKMLEEDLPDDFKAAPKPKEKAYITRQKTILEEKGVNQFEVLPLDWMMVRHYSGMPVYMHRGTRVCTLAKPYSLGKGNTRRHDIPISAIPCLAYRRALEEEEKQKLIDARIKEQIESGSWANNKVSNNEDIKKTSQLNENDSVRNENSAYVNVSINGEINEKSDIQKEDLEMEINGIQEDIDMKQFATDVEEKGEEKLVECPFKHEKGISLDKEDEKARFNESEGAKDTDGCNIIKDDKDVTKANDDPKDDEPFNRQPVVLPGGIVMPPPRVETVNTSWKTQQLTHDQVNDYCKKLFKFKTVNIMHFKRWADRRKYAKARKTLQYPTLPEGTKLITIPAQPATGQENGSKASKRDWVMNMNGRSYLSVFHEYVRRALQKQPVYEFKQLGHVGSLTCLNLLALRKVASAEKKRRKKLSKNASSPYQATVYIGGMQYGVGRGSSKRQAKSAAARASIHILIPEMRAELDAAPADPDFTFFDYVGIEDPRITEFCAATCEPSPHAILRTCLLRNFGAQDRHIHTEMKKLEYQKIELTMRVGRHSATVVCKNKKAAKQRASQAILQALHPHVSSWGSLLRLYGSRSVKSCKEKKAEEQQITLLQDQARRHEPNHAVLDKLRREMRRLRARDAAVVPLGTLLLRDPPAHSGANLDNVRL